MTLFPLRQFTVKVEVGGNLPNLTPPHVGRMIFRKTQRGIYGLRDLQ
ncbi:MAG: hypothetical protein ACWIPH_10285 [Ostreibacterium sp.]